MKKQDKGQEKTLTNHIPNKELISRIQKEFSNLNSKQHNLKIGKRFEYTFPKRYIDDK